MMLRWYLIQTKASAELVAQANLVRQGFEVYYPRALLSAPSRGQMRDQVVSLFPRYVFVRVDCATHALSPVRSTLGVSSIVRFGQEYAVVPDRIVRDLQARAAKDTGLHHIVAARSFEPGMAVTLTAPPFDGLQGIFQRAAGGDRVIVLLQMLGQVTQVKVAASAVFATNVAA